MKRILLSLLCLSATAWAAAQNINVIRTQPAGTLKTYLRSGDAFYAYYGEATMGTQTGSVIDIVTAPDGKTIYMKNPMSQATTGTWIKGSLGDDGKIHMPLEQCVQYFDMGYGWKTVVLKMMSYDDFTGAQYFIDSSMTEVTFSISADGTTITMDDLGGGEDQGGYPGAMYALVYTDDNTFVGYADYNSVYTPYNLTYNTIPEGLTTTEWTFTYSNSQPGETEKLPVAQDGNKLYIAGLSLHDKDAAMVGTIEGDEVRFESDQYLGYHSGYLVYAFGASYETKTFYDEEWDETYVTHVMTPEEALVCHYDEATGCLTAKESQALVLNMGRVADVGINYLSVSLDPTFQGELNGIDTIVADQTAAASYYDLHGRRLTSGGRGVTIVRHPDGTTHKMVVGK